MNQEKKPAKKANTRIWGVITISFIVASLACLIVNLAVAGRIDWAWYPLGSMAFAWCILSALLGGGKRRILYALIVIAVLIMPFLLLIESLAAGAWAWPVGFPIVVASLAFCLAVYVLFHWIPLNTWFRVGGTVLLTLPLTWVVENVVGRYTGIVEPWSITINTIICAGIAVILFVVGIMSGGRRRAA